METYFIFYQSVTANTGPLCSCTAERHALSKAAISRKIAGTKLYHWLFRGGPEAQTQ